MKRYTVKAFTIQSKWLEYDTDSKLKAIKCAENVECSRIYDNHNNYGKSPALIFSKGQEADVGKKYLINNYPGAAKVVRLLS